MKLNEVWCAKRGVEAWPGRIPTEPEEGSRGDGAAQKHSRLQPEPFWRNPAVPRTQSIRLLLE